MQELEPCFQGCELGCEWNTPKREESCHWGDSGSLWDFTHSMPMDKCKSLNHDCTDVNVAMNAIYENVRLFLSSDLLLLSNDLPHYYATLLDITASPPLKGEDFFFIKSCTRIVQILLLSWKNARKCCVQFNFFNTFVLLGIWPVAIIGPDVKGEIIFHCLKQLFIMFVGGNIEH